MVLADCISTTSRDVQSFLDRLAKLEFLEVLSLLELVFWRIKLVETPLDQANNRELASSDRESYRVHCGISIIGWNVLPYLGPF